MTDVFISYSRRDSAFITRLQQELANRGKDVWVDVEGIRDAEVFPDALRRAIEHSDAFVFVISPDSVHSPFCGQEVARAVALNKRIVPLALRPVPDAEIPEQIRVRQWIPVQDGGFPRGVDRLVGALDTDLEWERQHTRLTVKAVEWEEAGRDRSFLVRGSELAAAERWLAAGADKQPGPSALEQEYLLAARGAASRRQRTLVAVSGAVAVIAIALLVFALVSRGDAVGAQRVARSRALAAESQTQLSADPEVSILLAMQAVRTARTPEALYALREAIDQSPLRRQLPARGPQSCSFGSQPGVAYAPSGSLIAEGACDGRVLLVDDATGRVQTRIDVGSAAGPVAFSPDGRTLAVGTDRGVVMVDLPAGKIRETLATATDSSPGVASSRCALSTSTMPGALTFSPDGRRLAAAYDWNLDLWRIDHGVQPRVIGGPGACISDARFDPTGNRLIVANGRDFQVVDAASGRVRVTRPAFAGAGYAGRILPILTALALSPDGRTVAAGAVTNGFNSGTVALFDTATWRRVATLDSLPGVPIFSVAFAPDGRRLAIGAADGAAGIWSTVSHQQLLPLTGHVAEITSIAFRPDGEEITTASVDGQGRTWSARTSRGAAVATGAGIALERAIVSPTRIWGAIVGPGEEMLRSWTLAGAPAGRFAVNASPYSYAAGFSENGRFGAVVDSSGEVVVRDLAHARTVGSSGELGTIWGLALDPAGDRLIAGSTDGSFELFNVAQGMSTLADATVSGCQTSGYVAFSGDGRRAVGVNYCGRGILWDARSGRRLRTFDTGVQTVSAVSLDTHGLRLAVSSWDRTTVIWNLAAGRITSIFRGDTAPVTGVAFNPAGTWLATSSEDRDVRIWDADDGQLLRILPEGDVVRSIAFTADGSRVITTDAAGLIRIQDACQLCGDARGLLRLGASRVTRRLTPDERRAFGVTG